MAEVTVSVSGLAELDKMLKQLPGKIEGNLLRGALRAGQKVFLDAAKARVPIDSGELLDSLRIQTKGKSKKYGWVRVDFVAGNKKAWYAHLVEFGSASFYTGSGRTVGKPYTIRAKKEGRALNVAGIPRFKVVHPGAKPHPFMRPALDTGQGAALQATADYLRRRLPGALKKAGIDPAGGDA